MESTCGMQSKCWSTHEEYEVAKLTLIDCTND